MFVMRHDIRQEERIMDKGDLNYTIDMLKGNINRMCVTKTFKELNEMYDYAMERVMKIYSMNWDRLREEKNENID